MTELTEIYNFLPLTDTLLTSGQPTRPQFPAVAEAGVKAVINLALLTSTNAVTDEELIVRDLGMEYYHFPVEWENPSEEMLTKFMDIMDSLKDKKVLIHCAANMRVPTFVALYRILRLGWEHDKAFEDVHRIWNPYDDKNWQKFINRVLKKKK